MIKLKAHDKVLGQYSEIDKYALIAKKFWEDFEPGDMKLKINAQKVNVRIYDVLCDCVSPQHHHRLIDLRNVWNDLKVNEGDILEIEK